MLRNYLKIEFSEDDMKVLESYFVNIDRENYYGFSFKLLKKISDELGVFKPVEEETQRGQESDEKFMEKYELGGTKDKKRDFSNETDEERRVRLRDHQLKKDEMNFFQRSSGFGRQVSSLRPAKFC